MINADRLRQWADKIHEYGSDLSQWAGRYFIINELRRIADALTAAERKASALDWLEARKQTVEVRYDEVEKWVIEDINDIRYTGATLLEAIERTAKREKDENQCL